jgi:hypothetical protein
MDSVTFDNLKTIQQHLNKKSKKDNGFGKTCQILLAIAFCRLGYQVKNHCSEGVDIDIWHPSKSSSYSIEVKTTSKNTVQLGQKDVEDWEKKSREGYKTAFAVLRIELLSDWVVANAKGISAGNVPLRRLQSKDRVIPELQEEVNGKFSEVLADYATNILNKPQEDVLAYLDKCLEKEKKNSVARADETCISIKELA